MPATKAGFEFTDDDATLVKYIHECRFSTVDHLAALTERRAKDVHRRLHKLVPRNYLRAIIRRPQKTLYTTGKEGISVLVEHGVASRELLEWRVRNEEMKDLFLNHAILVSDIYVRLAVASRTSNLKLVEWRQDRGLWDSAPVVIDGEQTTLPVRPDAYFILEDKERLPGKNRVSFFVEADRSTTTHRRFQNKLVAYWSYLTHALQKEKLGVPHFRVATITLTAERAKGLCEAAREVLPSEAGKYFLFAPIGIASLENPAPIFGSVFLSPRDAEQHSLIPPAAHPLTAAGAGA